MPNITQEYRLLQLNTALGADKIFIRSINGLEGISQLFSYRVDAFAQNDVIDTMPGDYFSKLVGQAASVVCRVLKPGGSSTASETERFFQGIIQSVTRGARGDFSTEFVIDIVPKLWTLTRTTQSRIYQQKSVPDILKDVLRGIDCAWEIQGTFEPRDYCVQYRESDFDFASRLMEEEGIFYYFKHTEDGHKMVVGNTPTSHKSLTTCAELLYDPYTGGEDNVETIYSWEKTQTLRSGKTTLWDHSFELPGKQLEAQDLIGDTLQVGKVSHKLKIGGNENFELYDYPGGYAERFDGVNSSGSEQASEVQKIFEDNKRTAKIRMQQEAVNSIHLTGYTAFLGVCPGFKFALKGHYTDDDDYVITRCHLAIAQAPGYSAGDMDLAPPPEIVFNCVPHKVPYRPQRVTPKPVIYGTQSAIVVGPSGEEIFTDKYGRVKVKFPWDRTSKADASSSCWVRCSMPWAGKNWGFVSIPRIGHEVVVAFEEGDPDQPIIVGSVYNADQMPGYGLPDNKTRCTFKSRSSPGGGGFNEFRFEDKKDAEQIFIHAQKDIDVRILHDSMEWIGNDSSLIVKRDLMEAIERDFHRKIARNLVEEVGADRITVIKGKDHTDVTGASTTKVTGNVAMEVGGNTSIDTTGSTYIKSGQAIIIESTAQISLKVGGNFVDIGPSGVTITGTMVKINSGGAAGSGSKGSLNPKKEPVAAKEAATAEAGGKAGYSGKAASAGTASSSVSSTRESTRAYTAQSQEPTHNPESPENREKTHWVGIRLKDRLGNPIPGQPYKIVLPNGEVSEGTLNDKGEAKVEHTDPGQCKVSFPGMADWQKA